MTDRGRLRTHPKLVGLAIAVLAVVVTALLGGFREVPPAGPRLLAVGDVIDLGPLRVRPLRAWLGNACPLDATTGAPNSCLSIEAEITNITNESRHVGNAIRLVDPTLPADVFATLELVRDRWVLGRLQPNMPELVVISWRLPAHAVTSAPSSQITLGLWSTRFKKRDNLLGGEGWFDPREAARIVLPLTDADPAAMRRMRST